LNAGAKPKIIISKNQDYYSRNSSQNGLKSSLISKNNLEIITVIPTLHKTIMITQNKTVNGFIAVSWF
jgi:hypothetical protein